MDIISQIKSVFSQKTQDNEGWIRQGQFTPAKNLGDIGRNLFSQTRVDDDLIMGIKNVLNQSKPFIPFTQEWNQRPSNQLFSRFVSQPLQGLNNELGQYKRQGLAPPITGQSLLTQYRDKIDQFKPLNLPIGKVANALFTEDPEITQIKNKVKMGINLNLQERDTWDRFSKQEMIDVGSMTGAISKLSKAKNVISRSLGEAVSDGKKAQNMIFGQGSDVESYKLKPISDKVKQVHKLIFGDNRIPTSKRGLGADAQIRAEDNPLLASQKVVDMINRVEVNKKVNLFDYLATPEKVLERVGLKNEAGLLRSGYENYQKELKQELTRIGGWEKRIPGQDSSMKVFKWLDGQKVDLNPQEKIVASEIKAYLSQWADKLDIPYQSRLSNYITHIFEKGDIELDFNPDVAKMIEGKVSGSVYDPFLQKRSGMEGYVTDVWRALDAYVKRATRKVNMDPALDRIQMGAEKLDLESYKYIQRYISRVNMRPTEVDNLVDNAIKSAIGYRFTNRPTAYVSRTARQVIYRATLGLNPLSALKNLSQGANTYSVLGEKNTIKGYAKLVLQMGKNDLKELYDTGILDDGVVQDRSIHAVKKFTEKMDSVLFSMFDLAEKINRGAAYYGGKAKALSEGLTEKQATEYAKKVVRDTQFAFGNIDTPVALQGDITKIVSQYLGYSVKQVEFLGNKIANKDIAGLLRYTGAMMVFINTIGKWMGMDIKDLLPSFRFNPPAFQVAQNTWQAINPNDEVSPQQAALKLTGLVVPAGTAGRRAIEGVNSVSRGYAETKKGKKSYEIEQTPSNYLRAGLFGQYNLDEAQRYFDKVSSYYKIKDREIKSLNAEEQKLYEVLTQKKPDDISYSQDKQIGMAEALLLLSNPKVLGVKSRIEIESAKNEGKPLDPFYALTSTQQQTVLRLKTFYPGDKEYSNQTNANIDWLKPYWAARTAYFDELEQKGIVAPRSQDDAEYIEVSPELRKKLDYYYSLPYGTGQRSAYIRSNPDLVTYWDEKATLTNSQRERLGLTEIERNGGWPQYQKKVTLRKVTAPKIKSVKIKGFKPKTIKIKSPGTVKLTSSLKAKRIWPSQ